MILWWMWGTLRDIIETDGHEGGRQVQDKEGWRTDLPLAHGDAGAVPEALCHLHWLVVVMAAGAQGCAELVLVLREPLKKHKGEQRQ